jgi:WD40 repeat protein
MEARFRGADVSSVAFLPREEMVATGHEDGRLCLWLPRANRLRATLDAHAGRTSAICAASNPTGRTRVFSGGGDGSLRAWDALDGRSAGAEVEVTLLNVREASASPEGERVALGGDGGRIEVWRWAAERLEWHCAEHEFWITALAFSPDGRVLASGGYDRTVRLWSGASGALGREFSVHESFVSALKWAPGGDLLFSLSVDGALWAHDWRNSRSRQLAHDKSLRDFALHPDGKHLVAASPDGLALWRLE